MSLRRSRDAATSSFFLSFHAPCVFHPWRFETMPKRTDIHSVLIIGAGPIVIAKRAEFRLFRHAGLQGAQGGGLPRHPHQLQPGHIMTDPEFADRTYIETHHARVRRKNHRAANWTKCGRSGVPIVDRLPACQVARTSCLQSHTSLVLLPPSVARPH